MSVKKVRISELPQLQPDVSGEGLFLPAADENNQTYRVPLSRYDDAKEDADMAASAARAAAKEAASAAEAAMDAADKANGVVGGSPSGPAGGDLIGEYPNPVIKSNPTCVQIGYVHNDAGNFMIKSRIATFKSVHEYMANFGLVNYGGLMLLSIAGNVETGNTKLVRDGFEYVTPRGGFLAGYAGTTYAIADLKNVSKSVNKTITLAFYGANVPNAKLRLRFFEDSNIEGTPLSATIRYTNDPSFVAGLVTYCESLTYQMAANIGFTEADPERFMLRINYNRPYGSSMLDVAVEVSPAYLSFGEPYVASEGDTSDSDASTGVIAPDGTVILNGDVASYERRERKLQAMIDEASASGMTVEEFEERVLALGNEVDDNL